MATFIITLYLLRILDVKVEKWSHLINHQNEEQHTQKLSKSDLNLEMLKDFPFSIEVRKNGVGSDPLTVYICQFEGWNKEFTRTWNILDHARVHTGVKPFECEVWGKKFTQKGNLRKHTKTHTIPDVENRKRYRCEICSSSYTERYNYKVLHIYLLFSSDHLDYRFISRSIIAN